MDRVLDQVRRTIGKGGQRGQPLLKQGDRLVVGVSGGPDSLCLLHVLCRLQGEYGLELRVGHLHHGLRGEEADADAEFVRALAADWGVRCTVERADVPALARQQGLAFEEAARRARYAFLSRVAEASGARTIAVGHNADDQAETVLMHALRGSGLAGLRGMLPLTRLGDYRLLATDEADFRLSDLHLVRPLLEVRRAEIEAYCDAFGLEPRFDRSNLDQTYFRNWLRHQVLPLLEEHNPNVREVLCRTARVAADDYVLLRSLLEEAWPGLVREEGEGRIVFELEAWRGLPTALQRSTLREAIHRLRRSLRNINFLHVENALQVGREGRSGDQATLPRGLMLTLEYGRLVVGEAGRAEAAPDWPLLGGGGVVVPVAVPGLTRLPASEWALSVRSLSPADLPAGWEENVDPWQVFLDAQAAGMRLELRTRRAGDRFRPMGMGGHSVKLADLLTNEKVRRAVRERLPLLVAGAEIAWVCGLRAAEPFCVREQTREVLHVRFVR